MSRYFVLRNADIRNLLTPEEREQLAAIQTKIETERGNRRKEVGSRFFVLNVRDVFAQPALEAYARSAREDKRSLEHEGIKDALKASSDARTSGLMAGPQRLPSKPL